MAKKVGDGECSHFVLVPTAFATSLNCGSGGGGDDDPPVWGEGTPDEQRNRGQKSSLILTTVF